MISRALETSRSLLPSCTRSAAALVRSVAAGAAAACTRGLLLLEQRRPLLLVLLATMGPCNALQGACMV